MIINSIAGSIGASTRNLLPPNSSAAKNAKPSESRAPAEDASASVESKALSTEAPTQSVITSLGEAFRTLQFLKNSLMDQPETALLAQANLGQKSAAKLLA